MNECETLLRKFREERESKEIFLVSGGAKDYATYREVVGILRGLDACIELTTDLLRKQVEDDDD